MNGEVAEQALKDELATCVDMLVSPVRVVFASSDELQDLQKFVVEMRLTR